MTEDANNNSMESTLEGDGYSVAFEFHPYDSLSVEPPRTISFEKDPLILIEPVREDDARLKISYSHIELEDLVIILENTLVAAEQALDKARGHWLPVSKQEQPDTSNVKGQTL